MTGRERAAVSARLLGGAALTLFALSPLLPLATRRLPALSPLERAFDVWFDAHCQRDPARALSVAATPLAVCARCSGIYFGLGLGALLRRPRLSPRALRAWVIVGASLMLLDVALEEQGLHGGWPMLRLLTGVLLSYPVGAGLGAWLTRAPTVAHRP